MTKPPTFICSTLTALITCSCLIVTDNCDAAFMAYSLREAQSRIEQNQSSPEVDRIGGINRFVGAVADPSNGDIILVGQTTAKSAGATLDDFAIALRALLLRGTWPLVSIDNPLSEDSQLASVRFEGAIENTQFGKDLFEADVILKRLSLGDLPCDVWGFSSYYAMAAQASAGLSSEKKLSTKFWFFPLKRVVSARTGVVVLCELEPGVRVQVVPAGEASSDRQDPGSLKNSLAENFAEALGRSYDDIAAAHGELRRLRILMDLVALARGIKAWERSSALDFWLNTYGVKPVSTRTQYQMLTKSTRVGGAGNEMHYEVTGGVQLKTLLTRLNEDGDASVLREIVVATRPAKGSLLWRLPLEEWRLPRYALDDSSDVRDASLAGSDISSSPGCVITERLRPSESIPARLSAPMSPRLDLSTARGQLPDLDFASRIPRSTLSPHVGGVMLSGSAKLVGQKAPDAKPGLLFSLLANGENAVLSRKTFQQFVTTLWAVYYSKEDPGISIDPIARGVDKQLVRYIGRVLNTDLGRVMREADYTMKKWAVGTEDPDIPGFRDVDTLAGSRGTTYADASRRFWFVPADMTFKASENALIFDTGRMVLKTELMLQNRSTQVVDCDQKFADFFTKHYDDISRKYPVFAELFEYAKLVSLAKYLKEQGLPLQWFLLAHLDQVLTEDSKGAVDTLSKGSRFMRDVRIEGGVEMPGRYVLDRTASTAIQQAMARVAPCTPRRTTQGVAATRPALALPDRSFEFDQRTYSIVPQQSLSSGKDWREIRYQTDIAVRNGDQPGLELVRYFKPADDDGQPTGEFGKGWHLLIPYRVVPLGKPTIPFLNVVVPEKMAVRNLITGADEILTFDTTTYELAGYRPTDMATSPIIGMFWTVSGRLRLVDKIGNEFRFNEALLLDEMHLAEDYVVRFEYDYEEAGKEAYDEVPGVLAREGTKELEDYVAIGGDGEPRSLPAQLRLTGLQNDSGTVFTFSTNAMGLLGYAFDPASPLDSQFIAIRCDGKHILTDAIGNEIWFDRKLRFLKKKTALVKRVVQGSCQWNAEKEESEFAERHHVKLVYEFAAGTFQVSSAELFKKGLSTPVYAVDYHYTKDSMLARVAPTTRREASLKRPETKAVQVAKAPTGP